MVVSSLHANHGNGFFCTQPWTTRLSDSSSSEWSFFQLATSLPLEVAFRSILASSHVDIQSPTPTLNIFWRILMHWIRMDSNLHLLHQQQQYVHGFSKLQSQALMYPSNNFFQRHLVNIAIKRMICCSLFCNLQPKYPCRRRIKSQKRAVKARSKRIRLHQKNVSVYRK